MHSLNIIPCLPYLKRDSLHTKNQVSFVVIPGLFRFPTFDSDTYDFTGITVFTMHEPHGGKSGHNTGELLGVYVEKFRKDLKRAGITPATCTRGQDLPRPKPFG